MGVIRIRAEVDGQMSQDVALVTGASSGIGEAIARRLARDRKNLVVVARREDRLQKLARELSAEHGIIVHVIVADLDRPEAAGEIAAELDRRGLSVDWLINNAAFGTYGRFHTLPVDRELSLIRVNVVSLVELTRLLLPGMVARRRGAVVNLSSLGAFMPGPGFATYSATKAFIASFTDSLAIELRGTGVHVLCVCPGLTRTEYHSHVDFDTSKFPGYLWMTADEVADQAVRAVGKKSLVVNGFFTRLIKAVMAMLPRWAVLKLSDGVLPAERP